MRATLLLLVCTVLVADGMHSPVRFREHVIEPSIRGGYSVITADINHDGKPDVIGLTQQRPELAWYENPGWERHVFVTDMPAPVNMAWADIDGDGKKELINAPLIGANALAPKYEDKVSLFYYRSGEWKRLLIDDQ